MSTIDEQLNNPLHGLKLETLLNELVDHYGFEILAEYTNINCFKNKPSIASSLKFLKKTEWAREKMERFYLYTFKNLPKADDTQYEITPRKRVIPLHQKPREPKVLIPGEAPPPKEREPFQKRDNNSSHRRVNKSSHYQQDKHDEPSSTPSNPYANAPK
ncbi:VF530 family DNA-binding protein [Thalassotalea piscium]